jgi:hypothetical protein
MYCQSCGAAVAPRLSFCNHCGARVSATAEQPRSVEVRPEFLIAAMVGVFIFGVPVISVLIGILNESLHLAPGLIMAVAAFPFLLMCLLEATFLRLLFRHGKKQREDQPEFKGPVTREIDAAHARSLGQPFASVTEHTTRTFDPVYTERSTK